MPCPSRIFAESAIFDWDVTTRNGAEIASGQPAALGKRLIASPNAMTLEIRVAPQFDARCQYASGRYLWHVHEFCVATGPGNLVAAPFRPCCRPCVSDTFASNSSRLAFGLRVCSTVCRTTARIRHECGVHLFAEYER